MTLLQSCTIVVVVVLTAPPLSLHLLPSLISNCLNLPIGTQARLWRLCCCLVAKSCPPVLWPPWTVATMLLCTWDFPGNNTGLGCHFLLQGIFPTQGSNLCFLHWQADSLPLSHKGSPVIKAKWNLFPVIKKWGDTERLLCPGVPQGPAWYRCSGMPPEAVLKAEWSLSQLVGGWEVRGKG